MSRPRGSGPRLIRPVTVRQYNALRLVNRLRPSFVALPEEWTNLAMSPHSFSIASTLTWSSRCCRTLRSVSLEVLSLDETSDTSTGPFFLFLVPVFFIFQGHKLEHPSILVSSAYLVLVSLFCASSPTVINLLQTLFSFQGFRNGTLGCIAIKEVCSSGQVRSTGVNKSCSSLEVRVNCNSHCIC